MGVSTKTNDVPDDRVIQESLNKGYRKGWDAREEFDSGLIEEVIMKSQDFEKFSRILREYCPARRTSEIMEKSNNFKKESATGRKDKCDLDNEFKINMAKVQKFERSQQVYYEQMGSFFYERIST